MQGADAVVRIVHVETEMMSHAVEEIPAERVAMQVVAVRVYVVVGDLVNALGASKEYGSGFYRCERCILRAKNDFIDFALPSGEFAVGRKRAGDVRRVTAVLAGHIDNDYIAVLYFVLQSVVMQDLSLIHI